MKKRIYIIVAIIACLVLVYTYFFNSPSIDRALNGEFPELKTIQQTYISDEDRIKLEKNIEKYKENISQDSKDNYDNYLIIAENYSLLGNGEDARTYLLLAIEEDHENPDGYLALADLYTRFGIINVSEKLHRKAIELDRESVRAHLEIIDFYEKYYPSNKSAIYGLFSDARDNTNDDITILITYAKWLESIKEYVHAIDVYKIIYRKDQSDPYNTKREIERLTNKLG